MFNKYFNFLLLIVFSIYICNIKGSFHTYNKNQITNKIKHKIKNLNFKFCINASKFTN